MNMINALAVALAVPALTCTAEDPRKTEGKLPREAIRVLDVVVISTNRVILGTNTMHVSAATNLMARRRDDIDVVAVHGDVTGEDATGAKSATMAHIARVGVPLVVVEKEGEYAWRESSGADGVRTVEVGTDQFAALRRLWKRRKATPKEETEPALQTTVQWDTATGTYELNRVELGLFGRRVWLMHELRETDDESGTVGIQLKKEW